VMTAALGWSSDKMRRAGTCDQPPNRAGKILSRGWQLSPGSQGSHPVARLFDRGWITGSPLRREFSPHSGYPSDESVRSLLARGSAGHRGAKANREPKQAHVYQERTIGFRTDS